MEQFLFLVIKNLPSTQGPETEYWFHEQLTYFHFSYNLES